VSDSRLAQSRRISRAFAHEARDVDGNDAMSGIGRAFFVGIEIDHVAAERGAVEHRPAGGSHRNRAIAASRANHAYADRLRR